MLMELLLPRRSPSTGQEWYRGSPSGLQEGIGEVLRNLATHPPHLLWVPLLTPILLVPQDSQSS